MNNRRLLLILLVMSCLVLITDCFAEESFTITTYYPSPYGSYNELTTTGNTYLATSSSGRVGIGTTSPSEKLQVVGGGIRLDNVQQIGWGNNTTGIYASTVALPYYLTFNVNGDRMRINSNGNVGIGTTGPTARLHVVGGIKSSYSVAEGTFEQTGTALEINSGNLLKLKNTGLDKLTIGNDVVIMTPLNMNGNSIYSVNNVFASYLSASLNLSTPNIYNPTGLKLNLGTSNIGGSFGAKVWGDLEVTSSSSIGGNLSVSGIKAAAVSTSKGTRKLYSVEATDSRFEDFGSAQLIDGKAEVELDTLFLETVTISDKYPMIVTLTLTSDLQGIYVAKKSSTSFIVKEVRGGKGSATFDYRITALRKGFENKRLELADNEQKN